MKSTAKATITQKIIRSFLFFGFFTPRVKSQLLHFLHVIVLVGSKVWINFSIYFLNWLINFSLINWKKKNHMIVLTDVRKHKNSTSIYDFKGCLRKLGIKRNFLHLINCLQLILCLVVKDWMLFSYDQNTARTSTFITLIQRVARSSL